jgi:hypothetical protein
MTENECTVLMGFLRQLNQTPMRFKDPLANKLIREQMDLTPDAPYLLVQRAIGLELELTRLQNHLKESQLGMTLTPVQGPNPYGFINSNPNVWGQSSGTKPERSWVSETHGPNSNMTWEDKAVKILSQHSLKIWIAIAGIWGLAIHLK